MQGGGASVNNDCLPDDHSSGPVPRQASAEATSGSFDPAELTQEQATSLAHTLKALADPARLRALAFIARSPGGDACVCDLTEPLGLSQPTVSHHLKVLVDAGFLDRDKRGVWAWYSLVPGALDEATAVLPGLARLTPA
jgi:ArsR family transcriptional regulator